LKSLKQNLGQHCLGIHVRCRRDYEADKVWPRLGFVATGERAGRGKGGKILTEWWLDFRRPNLFSNIDQETKDSTLSIAIDAQVFFDLEVEGRPQSDDSRALQSDWIRDEVTLYLTGEMLNEVHRVEDEEGRRQTRIRLHNYPLVSDPPGVFQSVLGDLASIVGSPSAERDYSDLRHVAHAVAGEMDVFATRDSKIQKWRGEVYERFGLQILHPVEVLMYLDYLKDESRYRPVRLAGTSLESCQLRPDQIREISTALHDSGSGEKLRALQENLRACLSPRHSISNTVVRDENSEVQGIMTLNTSGTDQATVSFLRVRRTRLSKTLARHLFEKAVSTAMEAGKSILEIAPSIETSGIDLVQAGFVQNEGRWTKLSMPLLRSEDLLKELALVEERIPGVGKLVAQIRTVLQASLSQGRLSAVARIEKMLWPTLILDAEIPTYVVPIKPAWAKDLFDTRLADQDLFGADSELSLRSENVYYRAAKPNILTSPGRIIWYVSGGSRMQSETKCAKAWSHIEEVVVGDPKQLFSRHRRLGVYEWRHIRKLVQGDTDRPIMAIRFGRTQVFDQAVDWDTLQSVLES